MDMFPFCAGRLDVAASAGHFFACFGLYPPNVFSVNIRFRVSVLITCGFGCCMTSVDLLRRIRDQYGQPFSPVAGFGEDLSFCLRVRDSGTQIWCDSSVKCGHVGMAVYDENAYRALRGAQT